MLIHGDRRPGLSLTSASILWVWGWSVCGLPWLTVAQAQEPPAAAAPTETKSASRPGDDTDVASQPSKVEIAPLTDDVDISARLENILHATNWFTDAHVEVDEGIVFLTGVADRSEHKQWAGELARNTEAVVAVVNRMTVQARPLWDLEPARGEIETLVRESLQFLPMLGIASAFLILAWLIAGLSWRWSKSVFLRRFGSELLADVAARAVAALAFIVGLYLALRISGLTQIAATVVGGTGLLGLIFGIAFRDIAENFLASILISLQRPFALGDLIELSGTTGFVRSVTTRGTMLMTLEGNHVHIPNSVVFKSTIRNLSANPNTRSQFEISIGYQDSIADAQCALMEVLGKHEAVLTQPEPLVLVDKLNANGVTLRVYFWIDGSKHSVLKVLSAIIRLSKKALQDSGMALSEAERAQRLGLMATTLVKEPHPAHRRSSQSTVGNATDKAAADHSTEVEPASNLAEGGLESEESELERQAEQSRPLDTGANLLSKTPERSHAESPVASQR